MILQILKNHKFQQILHILLENPTEINKVLETYIKRHLQILLHEVILCKKKITCQNHKALKHRSLCPTINSVALCHGDKSQENVCMLNF